MTAQQAKGSKKKARRTKRANDSALDVPFPQRYIPIRFAFSRRRRRNIYFAFSDYGGFVSAKYVHCTQVVYIIIKKLLTKRCLNDILNHISNAMKELFPSVYHSRELSVGARQCERMRKSRSRAEPPKHFSVSGYGLSRYRDKRLA